MDNYINFDDFDEIGRQIELERKAILSEKSTSKSSSLGQGTGDFLGSSSPVSTEKLQEKLASILGKKSSNNINKEVRFKENNSEKMTGMSESKIANLLSFTPPELGDRINDGSISSGTVNGKNNEVEEASELSDEYIQRAEDMRTSSRVNTISNNPENFREQIVENVRNLGGSTKKTSFEKYRNINPINMGRMSEGDFNSRNNNNNNSTNGYQSEFGTYSEESDIAIARRHSLHPDYLAEVNPADLQSEPIRKNVLSSSDTGQKQKPATILSYGNFVKQQGGGDLSSTPKKFQDKEEKNNESIKKRDNTKINSNSKSNSAKKEKKLETTISTTDSRS